MTETGEFSPFQDHVPAPPLAIVPAPQSPGRWLRFFRGSSTYGPLALRHRQAGRVLGRYPLSRQTWSGLIGDRVDKPGHKAILVDAALAVIR